MRDGNSRDYGGASREVEAGASSHVPGRSTLAQAEAPGGQGTAEPLLCDDKPTSSAAMTKAAFLSQLKDAVHAAADQAMGASGSSADCPYIALYFERYSAEPASAVEALICKWVPFARNARSASSLIPMVAARVTDGVSSWRATGELPADLAGADPAFAQKAEAAAAQGPMTLGSMERQLGPGAPLDAGTAARMSPVVGADVSGARIHEGPQASALAAQHGAAAFAVGSNVVMGANAPRQGVMADALLAHELTHTAQQKDAAADPAQRHKPIGAEDDAAERDAGAERLARLGNFAGQVGDVMRTGVQLQRCDNNKLPPGPPMSGKQADAMVATVPMIADRIKGDLERGVNAENRTHFHETMESYVRAWHDESLVVQTMWAPGKTPEQLDQMKWEAARQNAAPGGGFTNYETDVMHIYKPGTPAFVTIHELIHLHTQNAVYGMMGPHFVEGAADYFTRIVCEKNKVPFNDPTYEDETKSVTRLAREIGDEALADLVFNGSAESAQQIVDSKGRGTWKKYVAAVMKGDYATAAGILEGAHEANDKRVADEQAKASAAEAKQRAEAAAKLAHEREGWPPEGHNPISGRVIMTAVKNGKGQATVSLGGRNGVRDGWKARAKLHDGETINATVFDVRTTTCTIEVSTLQAAQQIASVELSPP